MPSVAERFALSTSRLVGREQELAQLTKLLGEGRRVVTLLGAGGIGKTRLALELARIAPAQRVAFVDLSSARGPFDIVMATAAAIGVALAGGGDEASSELGASISAMGPTLLVLDNAEHVAESTGRLAARWSEAAPDLAMVITSRERLGTAGETVFELPPLAVPEADDADDEEIAASDGVRLFLDRASRARADFTLRAGEARTVGDLVRALDGLPLAIELCAARASVLGVEQLRALLPRRLDAFTARGRDAIPRHATLRQTIDWSWQLLPERERGALGRFSVFRGGFDVAAAAAVTGEALEHLDLVQALHDKSLLRVYEPPGLPGERRYALFESVREYAAEKLATSNERGDAERAHAAHFLERYGVAPTPREATDDASATGEHAERIERLALDRENLEAVARQALESPAGARVDDALAALRALSVLFVTRGPLARYVSLLRTAVERADRDALPAGPRARTHAVLGWALLQHGAPNDARIHLTRANDLARDAGDRPTEALALRKLAAVAVMRDDLRAAAEMLDRAEAVLAEGPEDDHVAAALAAERALVEWHQLRHRASIASLGRALHLYRKANDPRRVGYVLEELACRHLDVGDFDAARRSIDEALALTTLAGDRRLHSATLGVNAELAHEEGHLDLARELLNRALADSQGTNDLFLEAYLRIRCGYLALATGDVNDARRELARARDIYARHGYTHHSVISYAAAGAAAALTGDIAAAAADMERARATLTPHARPSDVVVVDTFAAHLDVAHGRRAAIAGDEPVAERHFARAREVLERPIPHAPTGLHIDVVDVRRARQSLARALSEPTRYLRVGPSAAWFRVPGGETVTLVGREVLRRILNALVVARQERPREPMTYQEIFDAGWPGERIADDARRNRVKVALTTLRKVGLRGAIVSTGGGYAIDAKLGVHLELTGV